MNVVPSVSVIVPFYNRSQFLKRLLDSVVIQSTQIDRVFIIDNGSSEQEVRIVWDIVTTHPLFEKCLLLSTLQRGNANIARNLGYLLARTEYVAFLDSDDWWEPQHLGESIAALRSGNAVGCYSGALVHRRAGRFINYSSDVNAIGCPFSFLFGKNKKIAQSSSFVVSKERLQYNVSWDERLKRSQDLDYFISIFLYTTGWVYKTPPSSNIDWSQGGAVSIDADSLLIFFDKWKSLFPSRVLSRGYLQYILVAHLRNLQNVKDELSRRYLLLGGSQLLRRLMISKASLSLYACFIKIKMTAKNLK